MIGRLLLFKIFYFSIYPPPRRGFFFSVNMRTDPERKIKTANKFVPWSEAKERVRLARKFAFSTQKREESRRHRQARAEKIRILRFDFSNKKLMNRTNTYLLLPGSMNKKKTRMPFLIHLTPRYSLLSPFNRHLLLLLLRCCCCGRCGRGRRGRAAAVWQFCSS